MTPVVRCPNIRKWSSGHSNHTRFVDNFLFMLATRRALLASLMIAVTVSLGYALAAVPNIELMTLSVFLAGYLLGVRLGALVGGAAAVLHSVFNPLGAALPPLVLAQGAGFALIGIAGGIVGPFVARARHYPGVIAAGAAGLVVTLVYDVLTNIGAFLTITGDNAPSDLLRFVAAGVLFMGLHLVWNTGVFIVVLRPVVRVLSQYRAEISGS